MDGSLVTVLRESWTVMAVSLGILLPGHPGEDLGGVLIEHNGRVKPFTEYARELVRYISGKDRLRGQEPVVTVLGMLSDPERWRGVSCIRVPRQARTRLGLPRDAWLVSRARLQAHPRAEALLEIVRARQARGRPLSPVEEGLLRVDQRCRAMDAVIDQELRLVPPPAEAVDWRPILQPSGYPAAQQIAVKRLWAQLLIAMREGREDDCRSVAGRLRVLLENLRRPDAPAPARADSQFLLTRR